MRKMTGIALVIIAAAAFMASGIEGKDAAALIKEAKIYIQNGNHEKAVEALDAAFGMANQAGDCDALMEIGDTYLSVDSSLKEKAMQAWTAAGRWKCK